MYKRLPSDGLGQYEALYKHILKRRFSLFPDCREHEFLMTRDFGSHSPHEASTYRSSRQVQALQSKETIAQQVLKNSSPLCSLRYFIRTFHDGRVVPRSYIAHILR